ncbi:SAM-dependent methyltransferase [Streptomyces cacaoi]|uniref:SAM-dependent methyltransferase n=1 Tax=Streptomyces cacaoi TaxID=1898 RepID=UPI001659398A|nr:SAM-dependent methyltransferase [Streptomyces cacaoi]
MTRVHEVLRPDDWPLHPSVPRIDDYLTRGREHYQVDRDLAHRLMQAMPWLPRMVTIARRHLVPAVTHLARTGITQYLDLGCGIPPARALWPAPTRRQPRPTTHRTACATQPTATVVYVDIDFTAYATTLQQETAQTTVLSADLRRPRELLDAPEFHNPLEPARPMAVLLHDVLPWLDDTQAYALMHALHAWLPPGSAISVTHAALDLAPHDLQALAEIYRQEGIVYRPRTREQIHDLLAPWPLQAPGDLVPIAQWTPAGQSPKHPPGPDRSAAYAALTTHPTHVG